MDECQHISLTILNPWEFVRKYRCDACNAVMMCLCDEYVASRFLPHQLRSVREFETGNTILVTDGFQKRVCNACRGLPPVANALAAIHGRTSKFKRYYWRELYFEPRKRFVEWALGQGEEDSNWDKLTERHREKLNKIKEGVTAELKALHEKQPRYHYEQEQSQAEVIERYGVEVEELRAVLIGDRDGTGVRLLDGSDPLTPEEFAERHLRRLNYDVVHTESVPLHALFAVLMWPLIEDTDDNLVQDSFVGERQAFLENRKGTLIHLRLPSDFGQPSYGHRRAAAIDSYLGSLGQDAPSLERDFDRLQPGSERLRQYLWAHREDDVSRARTIMQVVGSEAVHRILRFLVVRYWARYLGWPDILAFRDDGYVFVEVKASRDKLSDDQKDWIRGNSEALHLPFKILKIHATERR
jgi:hypothetical protein